MTISLTQTILNSGAVEYMSKQCNTLWAGTPFENYPILDPKKKGNVGEMVVSSILSAKGHTVKPAPNNAGYDRLASITTGSAISNSLVKVEIKFSLSNTDTKYGKIKANHFTFNHIGEQKDWARLIFAGIHPEIEQSPVKWMTKETFSDLLAEGGYFSRQQGGQDGTNDDYMITGNKFIKLLESGKLKDISEW